MVSSLSDLLLMIVVLTFVLKLVQMCNLVGIYVLVFNMERLLEGEVEVEA